MTDQAAFLRQHEAPLRSARPKALGDNGAGVTDVHLYRVQGDTTSALLSVSGVASTATPPASPPTSTPTATPTSTLVPATATPTARAATNQPFVTALSRHGKRRNNSGDLVGMKIAVGPAPLTVTSLGRYVETGNSRTHTLSIFRASDGALISSTTLNLATAPKDPTGYAYASLPARSV